MNTAEAKLRAVSWKNKVPTLKRAFELASMLGNPQDKLKIVHIAGTNGKGSVAAMTERILREAGYKTGLFTSPSLRDFNERMRINGKAVSEERLLAVSDKVMDAAGKMKDEPTEFETITVAMYTLFAEEGCDIAVVETGLGGILDATNIVKAPVLSVLTQIGLDHTSILGDTVEKIAGEKAGIIKKGRPCVTEADDPDALRVIEAKCQEMGSKLVKIDTSRLIMGGFDGKYQQFAYKDRENMRLSLLGAHQLRNAAAVIETVEILKENGFEIGEDAIRNGFRSTVWPARFQHVAEDLWVDGGHNPSGAETAAEAIKRYTGKVSLLFASFRDKEWRKNIDILAPYAKSIVLVPLKSPRSEEPEEIQKYLRGRGIDATVCVDVSSGLKAARALGSMRRIDTLAVGSLELAAEVLECVGFDCSNV